MEATRPCALTKHKPGQRCGRPMAGLLTHPQQCTFGPARQRPHAELKKLHFEVDVERDVPFFSSPDVDAIFDVVAAAHDNFEPFCLDAAVRSVMR